MLRIEIMSTLNLDLSGKSRIQEQVSQINFDLAAKFFREEVLTLATEKGISTDIAMAAMAELVGITAGGLDEREGVDSFQDRMHEFIARAEAFYKKRRYTPTVDLIAPEEWY